MIPRAQAARTHQPRGLSYVGKHQPRGRLSYVGKIANFKRWIAEVTQAYYARHQVRSDGYDNTDE